MNLAYKLRLAAAALADPEKGLSASDKGVLDISNQQSNGDIRAYFSPDDPAPTPTPVPAETPPPEESEEINKKAPPAFNRKQTVLFYAAFSGVYRLNQTFSSTCWPTSSALASRTG